MSSAFALALHTATNNLELALGDLPCGDDDAMAIHSESWLLGREMSLRLHSCLQEFMMGRNWQDCRFIAVAQGIGSYAGTRMGVVVARTLAQQLEIPLYGFDCEQISEYAQTKGMVNQGAALLVLAEAKYRSRGDDSAETQTESHWSSVLPLYAESV